MAIAFSIYLIVVFGLALLQKVIQGVGTGGEAIEFLLNGIGLAGSIYLLMAL